MTVFENVAYGLRLRKMAKAEIETRTKRILRAIKLNNLAERRPAGTLSATAKAEVDYLLARLARHDARAKIEA